MRHRNGSLSFALSLVALFGLAVAATAADGPRYVALRKKLHCDRKMTYATVQSNPAAHVGRVVELRGVVGGMAETSEGVTLMLNLADNTALTLDVPASEMGVLRESSAPSLRVLTKIEEGGSGNVVPLKVVALAHESAVSVIEAQEAARQAAIAKAEARRRAIQQAAERSRGAIPSRGGNFPRTLVNAADAQSLAAAYMPYLGPRAQPLFLTYLNFIVGQNRRLNLQQAGLITASLLHFSDRTNVDPRLIVAMIIAESNFDPNSTSRTGAQGLGQLMPGTARSLGVNNAYDPVENLRGSITYLGGQLNNYADKALPGGGMSFEQVALAMAAYNAGPGAVKKYGGVPPYRETQAYVRRVIALYQQLCQN